MRIPLAATLIAVSLVGCRTVWVHPEATAQKYADDTFFCKYGVERSEWVSEAGVEAERQRALAPAGGVINRAWKHCLRELGWTTTTGSRSNEAWSTPEATPSKRRRNGPGK
jgi:hypothetical protein